MLVLVLRPLYPRRARYALVTFTGQVKVVRFKTLAVWAALLGAFQEAHALPITIDLGPPGTVAPELFPSTFETHVSFSDLNSTSLGGQTLALDFVFPADRFVRLSSRVADLAALMILQTNGTGLVGYLQGAGYALDEFGIALHPPLPLGSASSLTGWMALGLISPPVTLLHDGIYGIHMEVLLPNLPGLTVIGGEFRFITQGASFVTGAHVPEHVNTLALLGAVCAALFLYRRRRTS